MAKLTAWETETITAALRSYKYVKDWKGRELVKDQAAMDQIDDLATKLEGARYVKLQLW
jgi:hypothetical protein